MTRTAIITYTDNSLPEHLAARFRQHLLAAVGDREVVCVSHRPVEGFSRNVVVGDIGRSYRSMFSQILAGCEATGAEYVAMAEHDVLYTPEHFAVAPSESGAFHYNLNCWEGDWRHGSPTYGMYSPPMEARFLLSQMVCSRELLAANMRWRVERLDGGAELYLGFRGVCEPGLGDAFGRAFVGDTAADPRWRCSWHITTLPNVDIRHGSNATSWTRHTEYQRVLPYWGSLNHALGTGFPQGTQAAVPYPPSAQCVS